MLNGSQNGVIGQLKCKKYNQFYTILALKCKIVETDELFFQTPFDSGILHLTPVQIIWVDSFDQVFSFDVFG
jgi:hypothetical protein